MPMLAKGPPPQASHNHPHSRNHQRGSADHGSDAVAVYAAPEEKLAARHDQETTDQEGNGGKHGSIIPRKKEAARRWLGFPRPAHPLPLTHLPHKDTMTLRDIILAAPDLKREPVEVPEWVDPDGRPVTVWISMMSGAERSAWSDEAFDDEGKVRSR